MSSAERGTVALVARRGLLRTTARDCAGDPPARWSALTERGPTVQQDLLARSDVAMEKVDHIAQPLLRG